MLISPITTEDDQRMIETCFVFFKMLSFFVSYLFTVCNCWDPISVDHWNDSLRPKSNIYYYHYFNWAKHFAFQLLTISCNTILHLEVFNFGEVIQPPLINWLKTWQEKTW